MEQSYQQLSRDDLKQLFLTASTGDPKLAHNFFGAFNIFDDYRNGNYALFHYEVISLLRELKNIDITAYNQIHKGFIYYYLGMALFQCNSISQAAFYFDSAVSEDLINDPGSRTPAIMFIEIDGDPEDQAAREYTQITERKLNEFITYYTNTPGNRSINITDLRSKLLKPSISVNRSWRTLATSLITFVLEWNYLYILQEICPLLGTLEPFFIHLFKGCVLVESLLKNNPTVINPGNTLGEVLHNQQVINSLNFKNPILSSAPSFQSIIDQLPGSNTIEDDFTFTVRIRNTLGHNLAWPTLMTPIEYINIVRKIANSILHVITCLY